MEPNTLELRIDLGDIFRLSHHEIVNDVLKCADEQSRTRADMNFENCLGVFIQEATKSYEDELRNRMKKRYEKAISQIIEQQR